ncbi:MAG: tyrosine-protein phosphatase [Rikenellaceae bacterium]|nr:tyrosine-protein phosphatase [Rikenellaceae bacterium]
MRIAEYSGENLTETVSVLRDKETKQAILDIKYDKEWSLFAGRQINLIDMATPVLTGSTSGTYSINVPDSIRSYFFFECDKGTAIIADKHLPMQGGYNFRDMGGYRNKYGKYVKWGKLIRSDELRNLTNGDLEYLASIPVRTVVDFRSGSEISSSPDRMPDTVKDRYELSINPGNLEDIIMKGDITPETLDEAMVNMYRLLVSDSSCIAQYKDFFSLLMDEGGLPLLYHCTAGKDRTGVASALFLLSLGIDRDIVMEDYLLSNRYVKNKYAAYLEQFPVLLPVLEVREQYLEASLDLIEREHGTVDNFLENVLGVELEKIRVIYLY